MAIGSDDLTAAQKMTVLGFGASSPRYWWSAAAMQAARIRCLQEGFAAILAASDRGTPVPAVGGVDARLYYPHAIGVEAHFFVSALRRLLRLARTYRKLTGDARIPDPEAEFAHLVGRPVDSRTSWSTSMPTQSGKASCSVQPPATRAASTD